MAFKTEGSGQCHSGAPTGGCKAQVSISDLGSPKGAKGKKSAVHFPQKSMPYYWTEFDFSSESGCVEGTKLNVQRIIQNCFKKDKTLKLTSFSDAFLCWATPPGLRNDKFFEKWGQSRPTEPTNNILKVFSSTWQTCPPESGELWRPFNFPEWNSDQLFPSVLWNVGDDRDGAAFIKLAGYEKGYILLFEEG